MKGDHHSHAMIVLLESLVIQVRSCSRLSKFTQVYLDFLSRSKVKQYAVALGSGLLFGVSSYSELPRFAPLYYGLTLTLNLL